MTQLVKGRPGFAAGHWGQVAGAPVPARSLPFSRSGETSSPLSHRTLQAADEWVFPQQCSPFLWQTLTACPIIELNPDTAWRQHQVPRLRGPPTSECHLVQPLWKQWGPGVYSLLVWLPGLLVQGAPYGGGVLWLRKLSCLQQALKLKKEMIQLLVPWFPIS